MADLDSITHTARRPHLCAGCGRTVHVGERYVRAQHPSGGRAAKQAFHSTCYSSMVAGMRKGK